MKILSVDYTQADAAQKFCQSLRETGFAVLSNHPIPNSVITSAYGIWTEFFNAENKADFLYQKPSQAGYFPFKTENAKNQSVSDLKEFFHFYPWSNVPDEARDTTFKLYSQLTQLASQLLQWVESCLPKEIASSLSIPLCDMINESPKTLLRILHYPPLTAAYEDGAVRAAAHEDINLITLLPAATAPGLEVLDIHGNWHAVSCDPGNVVVNVGDMLQLCTNNYYRSTTHRVVNPEDENKELSRFSMPLFLHPRGEVALSQSLNAEDYLNQRLAEIGIY